MGNRPKEIKVNGQFHSSKIRHLLTWRKKTPMGKPTTIPRKLLNIPQNIWILNLWKGLEHLWQEPRSQNLHSLAWIRGRGSKSVRLPGLLVELPNWPSQCRLEPKICVAPWSSGWAADNPRGRLGWLMSTSPTTVADLETWKGARSVCFPGVKIKTFGAKP